jgi:hypothetical protein
VARCRRTRRHPAPCSASASSPGVSVPPLLAATRLALASGASAATRRKTFPPAPPPLLPLSPLSLLSAAPRSGKGGNPRTAWLARRGLGHGCCRRTVKAARGQGCPGAPGLAAQAGSATWPALSGRHGACRVTGKGIRDFSPVDSPWGGPRARARARRACQLGGPAVPSSRARLRCGAAARGWLGRKRWGW